MMTTPKAQPVLVKRYARSRLYDTTNQCYVSMEQLRGWVSAGIAFSVIDSDTGADVTDVLLA
jgi:polyhydroxyalkanoate synthesis regulator protein